jgi:hypothetical protein
MLTGSLHASKVYHVSHRKLSTMTKIGFYFMKMISKHPQRSIQLHLTENLAAPYISPFNITKKL